MSTDARVTRLTGVGALTVAVLYAVSVPLGSLASAPATDASGPAVAQFYSEHRTGLLAALVLNGIAWCALMPAVFVGLRARVGPRDSLAATVALIAAAVEAALIGVALLLGLVAAYEAPHLAPQAAKSLNDAVWIALNVSAWPTVPCVLGLVLATWRTRVFPISVVAVGVLVAIVHAVTSISFARAGVVSPAGIGTLAAPAFALWLVVIAVALLRRPAAHQSVAPAAA